jgi:hypothetical protein
MEATKPVDINALALDYLNYCESSPSMISYISWELRRGYKLTSLQASLVRQTANYLLKHGNK